MKIFYSTFLVFFISYQTTAQDLTLYNMPYIQQRVELNPAFLPKSKVHVSIPGLSSLGISFSNSGFKYADLVKLEGDSLRLDVDNMLNEMSDENKLIFATNLQLFGFGLKLGNNYFNLAVNEKANMQFNYPKDFFSFLWDGNAANLNQASNFNFKINAIHYREYALGYNRTFNDKLSIGGRLKYIYGLENISTNASDITVTTNEDSAYAMTITNNIEINTSGLGDVDGIAQNYLFGKQNTGFAVDLGFNFHLTEKLSINGSALNLGSINWKSDVENYISTNPNAIYVFEGYPLRDLSADSSSSIATQIADSLKELFRLDSNNLSYSTGLNTQYHLATDFKIVEGQHVGAHLLFNNFNKIGSSALSLYYTGAFTRVISASVSYTMINGSFSNLGVGLRLNGGPLQWYILTDNLLSFFTPEKAQYFNFRTGFNLTFGKHKDQ